MTEARLRAAPLTYDAVGATATGSMPPGERHLHVTRLLGRGQQVFDVAVGRLMSWDMHRRAGLGVRSSSDVAAAGEVVVLSMSVARLAVSAPCRVVAVVDEPRRRGFTYGTLPGHPESGEESFLVELGEDGAVTVTVVAFSRPATRLSRWAGRLVHRAQHRITLRYLAALT